MRDQVESRLRGGVPARRWLGRRTGYHAGRCFDHVGSQFGFQLTPVDGILVSRQNSKDGGEGVALDPLDLLYSITRIEGPVSSTEVAVVALREFSGGSFGIGGIRQVANHHRDLIA
jgi:hypothetical protein